MKRSLTLLCLSALSALASAQPSTDNDFAALPTVSAKRVSGSLTLGYDTLGNDRGVVLSHSVVEGDGSPFASLKLNYDFGRKGGWSYDSIIYYRDVTSGHRLYGNPTYGPQTAAAIGAGYALRQGLTPGTPQFDAVANQVAAKYRNTHVKQANCEPEIAFVNDLRYTQEKWNVSFGHTFIHGGILGVMAKHFRHQGASCVNEAFIRPELTPYKWVSAGVTTRYSFSGIDGWWFEPDITFKAPLIGTEDNVKVAAVLKLAMTATANYFNHTDAANGNGSQAYYTKLYLPWMVNDHLTITPGIGLHWAGRGAVRCNEKSAYARACNNNDFKPFRNFAVVGTIMCTYSF
ncbi:MAG: hypothetical protein ACI4O9_07115 [Akkermansia sp.]